MEHIPGRVKAKTIKLVFAASSLKHSALRTKSKDWLLFNKNIVFKWNNMSTREFLFQ